ncbi:hypothetical protein KUTeg_017861 [Tegillarca granosa]|uniref:YqaJ viral recombinase domain-containing protein n=1 Tax=Tegillarca granosa TaxID=220873 RepID=A0ABQ9EG65_TEGGR|nr:hypothetical protein KUTeg_017861 [Tegillarca granosa]
MEIHIDLSDEKIKAIQSVTKKQSATSVWNEERKMSITTSNFRAIVRRNPKIKVEKLVKRLLYPTFKGNSYTRKGLNAETMTIKEYELRKQEEKDPVTVEGVGLVIDKDEKYLEASPDGIINLYQAAHGKEFCLELVNNELHLKKSRDYFFQVQGQLNICNMAWVDFVVRTEKPYQLHIERIKKDKICGTIKGCQN